MDRTWAKISVLCNSSLEEGSVYFQGKARRKTGASDVVVGHPQVFSGGGGGGWGWGGRLVFFCPDPCRKWVEQLHRTIAFFFSFFFLTNMTYNNCGSSTVQPKVHKVCFSGKKNNKIIKSQFFTTLEHVQLNTGVCISNCSFNTIPTSVFNEC